MSHSKYFTQFLMPLFKFLGLVCLVILCACSIEDITDDFYILTMSPATMREQFNAGMIDGFIAWEPFNAEVVISGRGKYLIQSAEVWPNHPCCVLAVRKNIAAINKALLWTHIQATNFILDDKNKQVLLSPYVPISVKDNLYSFAGISRLKDKNEVLVDFTIHQWKEDPETIFKVESSHLMQLYIPQDKFSAFRTHIRRYKPENFLSYLPDFVKKCVLCKNRGFFVENL